MHGCTPSSCPENRLIWWHSRPRSWKGWRIYTHCLDVSSPRHVRWSTFFSFLSILFSDSDLSPSLLCIQKFIAEKMNVSTRWSLWLVRISWSCRGRDASVGLHDWLVDKDFAVSMSIGKAAVIGLRASLIKNWWGYWIYFAVNFSGVRLELLSS